MNIQRGKLVSGGRLQIPVDIRNTLGLSDGDEVRMEVINGELRVRSFRETLSRVRERLQPYIVPGVSIVDELIAERRAEAERE